jgi:hypothetical protein|tara:strand:+ start:1604 stop:1780 length:177 start_codon:yes stop_codon:yes gene_type:complete
MNKATAKQIRKILNYDPKLSDATQKRVYSRAKKQYNKLSEGAKILFLQELENLYNQSK